MALVAPELYDRLVALRRELHRHPELSGQEARTATVISRFLHDLGIHHRTNVAGHGVVADLHGNSGGASVVLRADTDALPIQEETGLMHACGHVGDALTLRRNNPRIIPEAYALANLVMSQPPFTPDFIVDEDSASYPPGGDYRLEQLQAEGYPALLRIERGRVRNREIFWPMRLDYGFFKLQSRQTSLCHGDGRE